MNVNKVENIFLSVEIEAKGKAKTCDPINRPIQESIESQATERKRGISNGFG